MSEHRMKTPHRKSGIRMARKGQAPGRSRAAPRWPGIIGLAVLPCLGMATNVFAATTLPTGGQVAAGSATISRPNAQTLQINQASRSAILNWGSFSIGADGAVNFLQPGASSVTLNRVLGNSPSEIFGRLTANGQIFLLNPNGVLFGRTASVDVGGLAASTLGIQDGDFLAGRYVFARDGAAGSVVNQGTINAPGGYAALIGPNVSNEGLISARLGSVALAAGDRVTLDLAGDGLIRVQVDQAALGAAAINKGTIEADGGHVIMLARSADALLDTVLGNEGVIRAHSLVERNGAIFLDGGTTGVTSVTGTLDASGKGAGQTGGTVTVLGDKVGLFDNARIDVSGDAGGGSALVGGNYQGLGPQRNANAVFMGSDALVTADALANGNGGKVVLWSDGFTSAHGTIYARGGARSGDGGQIETSGHQILDADGVRGGAGAPNGKGGLWLFDPDADVTITTAANANGGFSSGTWTPTGAPTSISNIQNSVLNTQLNGGTNVTVTTSKSIGTLAGNITVSAAITNTSGGTRTLSLNAGTGGTAGSVTVNNLITGSTGNSLAVNLNAGAGAGVSFGATGSITTSGGNIQIVSSSGGVSQIAGSTLDSAAGTILVNGGGGPINMLGQLITTSATANAVTIRNASTVALGKITANSGTLVLGEPGNLINGAVTQNASTAITATTLTANTASSVNLSNANTVANLGTVSTGAFTLLNARTLIVTGAVNAATLSATTLTTTGALSDIVLNAAVGNASGATVLTSAGIITGTATVSGSSVTLDSATGVGTGAGGRVNTAAVTLAARTRTSGGVFINETDAVTLDTINAVTNSTAAGGAYDLVAGGAITQGTGALTVTGTSSFSAGANPITLTTATNNFTGAVSLNNSGAESVAVTDVNAIVLGASSVGQDLAVTAGGHITQSGALTVPGTSLFTIDTNPGQDVLLASAANNLTGAVTVANGTGTVRDVALRNTNALAAYPALPAGLRNLSLQFDNAAVALPATSLTGNLAVTSGGAITQSGILTVPGTSNFSAGANSITLTLTNDFQSAVTLSGGATDFTLNALLKDSARRAVFNTDLTGKLTVSGPDGNYFFAGSLPGGGVSVSGTGIRVYFNGFEVTTSLATQQVAAARTSVSVSVLTAVADETKKSFGTDSVAQQIDYGFAGDVGVGAPMDHRIAENGISVPYCFVESQQNTPCR